MPIRFSGSARPRKLKSPDPINMPSVRENIVPRIKAEVAYYKTNGSMPQQEPFVLVDYQTSGDKLLFKDMATGLEYLIFAATAGMSINTAYATFTDFRAPTASELTDMISRFIPEVGPVVTNMFVRNNAANTRWRSFFGEYGNNNGGPCSYGAFHLPAEYGTNLAGFDGGTYSNAFHFDRNNTVWNLDTYAPWAGVWLVRDPT